MESDVETAHAELLSSLADAAVASHLNPDDDSEESARDRKVAEKERQLESCRERFLKCLKSTESSGLCTKEYTATGSGLSNHKSPAKRAYGQVTKLAEDKWRCPDGKVFPRSHMAYRYLKNLRERNNASAPLTVGSFGDGREMVCPQKGCHKMIWVLDRQLYYKEGEEDISLYSKCRRWVQAAPPERGPVVEDAARRKRRRVDLPDPHPHNSESKARLTPDKRKRVIDPECPIEDIVNTATDVHPEDLLASHLNYYKKVRTWHKNQYVHRLARYSDRLRVVLPEHLQGELPELDV